MAYSTSMRTYDAGNLSIKKNTLNNVYIGQLSNENSVCCLNHMQRAVHNSTSEDPAGTQLCPLFRGSIVQICSY